ncbi:MAG: DNA mismatch repair protein MutS [Sphingomonadaceae bacterium]|nr:DNA mismatch repair protein MutS [Sphingomonadaceae bacterium]
MAAPTPMLAQYLALKRSVPDALLFYRMGDFYELFFDDAAQAAAALQITLTRRGTHEGADIPMCGVPVHAADGYLARLVRAGHAVAIAEQIEDPAAARRENRPVRRAIVRTVTPATLTEDGLLDPAASNWLAYAAPCADGVGLAWADVSTGHLFATTLAGADELGGELARIGPAELLAPEGWADRPLNAKAVPPRDCDPAAARRRLTERFGVVSLDAFGAFTPAELAALGGLAAYIDLMSGAARPRLDAPQRVDRSGLMAIDAASRSSLGLGRDGLLGAVDRTLTAAGARRLAGELASPLTRLDVIGGRHDAVERLVGDAAGLSAVRKALKGMPDLERPLARLAAGRGTPRDLAAIGCGLIQGAAVVAAAGELAGTDDHESEAVDALQSLAQRIVAALGPAPGGGLGEGGYILAGYDAELDLIREAATGSTRLIAELETEYRAVTGVGALKIRHNGVLGWHIEAPARADAAFKAAGFVHRQTLAGSVRFGSDRLAELAAVIADAGDRALARERQHFDALSAEVIAASAAIRTAADALARIDVAASHAELARSERWVRPLMTADRAFRIEGGRHPVVERALGGTAFVANDCDLSDQRLWLVTGPNMGGKSTFLRQNALIAILAQAGAFVPARAATLGVVDRLFSRVGASDDLAQGRSTFMVEMVETAAILRQATSRSLVILDEVGRGTSTYDGLAIAWGVLEWLHDRIGCRALFATHYHEMTRLADRLDGAMNAHVRAREWKGELVFLHEVAPGPADRSYGLAVAKLAGVPDPVIARARAVLDRLEAARPAIDLSADLPLFAAAAPPPIAATLPRDELRERLRALDPDDLSPREAHALLGELRLLAS